MPASAGWVRALIRMMGVRTERRSSSSDVKQRREAKFVLSSFRWKSLECPERSLLDCLTCEAHLPARSCGGFAAPPLCLALHFPDAHQKRLRRPCVRDRETIFSCV